MEMFINIIVGLLTGCISSFIVTLLWQKRQDNIENDKKAIEAEQKHTHEFRNEVQTLCHYLRRLELELELPPFPEKYANLRRLVDSQPATPSFVNGMTEVGVKLMSDLHMTLHELNLEAIGMSLTEAKCSANYSVIFKIECELFKKWMQIQKPWTEYVQQHTAL